MVIIDESEKKQIIQDVIDRLQYCDGFKGDLRHFLEHYSPHNEVKYTTDPKQFKFPISKAI